jgi:hypothetical protein
LSYKCPLCLAELTEGVELVRFCTDHPRLAPVTVTLHDSEESLPDEIYCTGGDGRCNSAIQPGVFIRHIDCQAKNPFWDGNTVDIPGGRNVAATDGSEAVVDNMTDFHLTTATGGRTIKVTHWQIGMLKTTPPSEEMWFPLMLLRATSETRPTGNGQKERVGALVELAGAATVGKTVLAMQAMEYDGYSPDSSSDKRHIEVTGYMFSRLPPGRSSLNNPFLGTLYYNNLMVNNEPGLYPLDATLRMPGDVKAAFVVPSKKSHGPSNLDENVTAQRRGPLRKIGSGVWQFVKGGLELFWSPSPANSFWYTVVFYDVAGESFRYGDTTPDDIERAVDKVAILVDAEDIFGKPGAASIAIANQRIHKVATQRKLPHCLVVTKLDLVTDRLSEEEKRKVHLIAEDLTGDRSDEAKTLLMSWLNQAQNNESIKQLKNRLTTIEKVFFVWTENLPVVTSDGSVQTSAQQPRSFGLARFICWCLNTSWDDLNQR